MRAAAFLYPWDVIGDPEAAPRLAGLGIGQVTLASAYHSTRALTPRHPAHRVVTARHSAVLYPPEARHWQGRALRPCGQQDWAVSGHPGGAFGEAAEALAEAGLRVHSWAVLAHDSRLGGEFPQLTVENAYGDRYPWAPCVAQPRVREYLVALAAEAGARPGAEGTELESCGWYGFAHLHAHDKTRGVELGGAGEYAMSLCFCEHCRAGYEGEGADPERLRTEVRRALAPLWRGERPEMTAPGASRARERELIGELLGEYAEAVARWRGAAARRLRREAVAAVRERAAREGAGQFRVLLHADPAAHRTGANAGTDPAEAREDADGVVVPCAGGAEERTEALTPFAAAGRGAGTLAANFPIVSGMGGSPESLAADAAHAADLGATELRLYHAGLASDADLEHVRRCPFAT
ncbi:hypothetical protein [Streptomyces sp. ODS28]|uniref:hypothetical protein n=1 Tax=Streptomyces sp. ODS28 TaxID=3136688 RepID=UPI0031EAB8D6